MMAAASTESQPIERWHVILHQMSDTAEPVGAVASSPCHVEVMQNGIAVDVVEGTEKEPCHFAVDPAWVFLAVRREFPDKEPAVLAVERECPAPGAEFDFLPVDCHVAEGSVHDVYSNASLRAFHAATN